VPDPRFVLFLVAVALPAIVATVVGAALAPPDPLTRLRWLAGTVAVAAPVAYLVAFRGGYERLRDLFGLERER
jgi:hypothetical protein